MIFRQSPFGIRRSGRRMTFTPASPLGSLQKRARRVLSCQDPQSELLKCRLIYHEAGGIRRFAGFARGAAASHQAIRYTLPASGAARRRAYLDLFAARSDRPYPAQESWPRLAWRLALRPHTGQESWHRANRPRSPSGSDRRKMERFQSVDAPVLGRRIRCSRDSCLVGYGAAASAAHKPVIDRSDGG